MAFGTCFIVRGPHDKGPGARRIHEGPQVGFGIDVVWAKVSLLLFYDTYAGDLVSPLLVGQTITWAAIFDYT